MSIIGKYHNHKLQTNPWHREEEQHNINKTTARQTKQSNQHPLPHQDDCKTRKEVTYKKKPRTVTNFHSGSNNKQQIKNNRITALERTAA